MDVIYLLYGFSFFALGIAILVREDRGSTLWIGRQLWLMGIFGAAHGFAEWTDLWRVVRGDPIWLAQFRPWLISLSFIPLLEFGRRVFVKALIDKNEYSITWYLKGRVFYPLTAGLFVLLEVTTGKIMDHVGIWSRYLIATPALMMSALGLHYLFKNAHELAALSKYKGGSKYCVHGLIFSLFGYGIAAGIVVPQSHFFPASVINQESFLALTGIPIQAVRALFASTMTLSIMGLINVLRRESEFKLRKALELAYASTKSKSEFLSNMSHEIRTPMNAILGMLKLLLGTELTPRQLDYAGKSEGAAKSLLALINDILDFSKIEAGKLELELEPFVLDGLLRNLSVIVSVNVGSKPLEVLFDVDPQTPALLIGDAMRLQQILINLCSNAIKFTAQGEVVIKIEMLERKTRESVLRFSVRDSGIGIAPENQLHIFTGFSQAEASTTRRFGGTGLGLSICKRLVTMMGGDLTVQSALGAGSTFCFTVSLPVAEPLAKEADQPDSHKPSAFDVLVVDDNALARNLLAAMAVSLAWRVDAVADGAQAVAMVESRSSAQQAPYQAIFMDWEMPGMDGWDAIGRIRKTGHGQSVPITVMVTSHSRESLSQRSVQEQAQLNAFLVKPITASMMLEAVNDAKEGHSRLRSQVLKPTGRLRGMHLLVVEDNPINQQVAQELLVAEGAHVWVAENGLLGVSAVAEAKTPFHAVLMDIQMPVMDGYAATHAIRHELNLPDLPVIAMTANAMASDREACLAAGMNDHIGKPFDLAHLISVLLKNTGFQPPVLSMAAEPIPPKELTDNSSLTAAVAEPASPLTTIIDTQIALRRLSGMKPLYVRLMREFSAELEATMPEYRRLIAASLRTDAARQMHTLKGTAATLGANQLSDFTRDLEKQLKDPSKALLKNHQVDELKAVIDATLEATLLVVAQFEEAKASAQPKHAQLSAGGAADTNTLLAQLTELKRLLTQSDLQALERFSTIRLQLATLKLTQFAAFEQAIQDLDFPAALVLCREISFQLQAVGA